MAFWPSVVEGWYLFKDSLRVVRHRPILLVPILFGWIVVAAIDCCAWYFLYAKWHRSEVEPSPGFVLACIYSHVFLITMTICIVNVVMLEFMQQMESGQNISFSRAIKEAVVLDLLKMIPLAAVWAVLWVLISILKSASRRKRGGSEGSDFIFNRIQEAIRMAVFLALPAIAWENKGPFSAIVQSVRIIRKHSVEFLTAYTLTALTGLLLAAPLLVVCGLCKSGVAFPTIFWAGVIIYVGLVWSLGIYVEQMSLGLLYLWHLRWAESGSKGRLSSVPEPDLLDEVYELAHITSPGPADEPEGAEEMDRAQRKFRTACKQALADGRLSVDEKYDLKKLGKSLNLSREDMQRIFQDERRIFRITRETGLNPNVELQFRKICKETLADGKVTPEEKRQLKSLAEFFNIPRDIVRRILEDEVKSFRQKTDS